jgi:hypothetical protein
VINGGDGYTTSGAVSVRVQTKPTDNQSGVDRYVWSTQNSRPAGGMAYSKNFSASIAKGSRGTRTIYVWFRNGDGIWSTSPIKDSITFDRKPIRASHCPAIQDWEFTGVSSNYDVWVQTSCFSDPDGDPVTIYFSSPSVGRFEAGAGSCEPGRSCLKYYPPAGWDQNGYTFNFVVYAKDDLGAKSGSISVSACVAC